MQKTPALTRQQSVNNNIKLNLNLGGKLIGNRALQMTLINFYYENFLKFMSFKRNQFRFCQLPIFAIIYC